MFFTYINQSINLSILAILVNTKPSFITLGCLDLFSPISSSYNNITKTFFSASQNGNSSPKQHQDKSGGYQSPELNSAKKLASMLGKKSMEQLRELNITLERESSTSCSEDDGPTIKQPPLKRLKKQKDPTDGVSLVTT